MSAAGRGGEEDDGEQSDGGASGDRRHRQKTPGEGLTARSAPAASVYDAEADSASRGQSRGGGLMYWAPEFDLWNADGSPGPAVFTLDHLQELTARLASKVPAGASP